MSRYVAFLRGLNVRGRTVKMDDLRQPFECLGFDRVSTFIASGNVMFETDGAEPAALETRIEQTLREALGYEVATFLRTDAEVARIAAHEPFPDVAPTDADTRYVSFLKSIPDEESRDRVRALSNDHDRFQVHERELYWLRRGTLLESTVGDAGIARALGRAPITTRNANTLRRIAAKYPTRPAGGA